MLVLRLLSVTNELLGLGAWNLVRRYSINMQLIHETFLSFKNYKHGDIAMCSRHVTQVCHENVYR